MHLCLPNPAPSLSPRSATLAANSTTTTTAAPVSSYEDDSASLFEENDSSDQDSLFSEAEAETELTFEPVSGYILTSKSTYLPHQKLTLSYRPPQPLR
jgi:hypothetical protein